MTTIYGDMEGTLEGRAKGQTLTGDDEKYNFLYGDTYRIENAKGGNDVLIGGANSYLNVLYGDAYQIFNSLGGNDVLTGGASSYTNILYGDAEQMSHSQGGNDVLIGGDISSYNILQGDADQMYHSKGGNDLLTGGSGSYANFLYGDAYQMFHSQGGNDVLIGGALSEYNLLFGDAIILSDSQGGNDILIASDNPISGSFVSINHLFGDAQYHWTDDAICGNDRLISGTGNDDMWGDIAFSEFYGYPIDLTRVTTGHDVFVFSSNNGNDTIHDFRQGEDKIELQGMSVASFDALMTHLQTVDTNTVITFESNTITVIGVTELTAADFLFT